MVDDFMQNATFFFMQITNFWDFFPTSRQDFMQNTNFEKMKIGERHDR